MAQKEGEVTVKWRLLPFGGTWVEPEYGDAPEVVKQHLADSLLRDLGYPIHLLPLKERKKSWISSKKS